MPLLEDRLGKVHGLMEEMELDAAVFSTQANFAWLTGGADNHVGLATEAGAAAIVVTPERAFILCDNIEAPRISTEEVGSMGLRVIGYSWWEGGLEDRISALVGSEEWAADTVMGDRMSIEPFMYSLRCMLSHEELHTYRALGKLTGLAVQEVASRVETGQAEHEVAGVLAGILISRGVVPHVVLVAADDRIGRYRHPIPKSNRIEKMCMIVVGARWKGLICSITRIVHFGKPDEELARKHRAVCEVDAAFISHTLPGETIGDTFQAGIDAYADAGFPDEWKLHHQGGPTGYKPREFRATQDSPQTIVPNQAFAWNPTITGTKSEDTIIAGEPLPEILTLTPDWPTMEIETGAGRILRPDILIK